MLFYNVVLGGFALYLTKWAHGLIEIQPYSFKLPLEYVIKPKPVHHLNNFGKPIQTDAHGEFGLRCQM